MKALGFREHGGLENLTLLDLDEPAAPGPGEARVRVEAAALNRLDLFVLKGWPGLELEKPHVGGSDLVGVVDAVGDGVEHLAEGDRVVLYPSLSCGDCRYCAEGQVSLCPDHRLVGEHERGTLVEEAVLPAANLWRVPDDTPLSTEQLAAAPLTFLTAWRMLVTRGELQAGEDVLVVGAGGGVNTAAVQIAEHAGADVTVVAGGAGKAKRVRDLGAVDTVDYTEVEGWHKELLGRRDGEGFDVVVDNVGEATWTKSLKACARGGRVLVVGGTTGYNPPAGLNYLFWKQIDIRGSTMGTPREFDTVMDRVFQGTLEPQVARSFPLEEGAEAYRFLRSGDGFGNVVVTL